MDREEGLPTLGGALGHVDRKGHQFPSAPSPWGRQAVYCWLCNPHVSSSFKQSRSDLKPQHSSGFLIRLKAYLGVKVAHACDPSSQEAEEGVLIAVSSRLV